MRRSVKAGARISRLGGKRVVVLAAPPVEELDIVGPWEVFASANSALRNEGPMYEIQLVTTGRELTFLGDSGLTLSAKLRYRDVRTDSIDTLIVPGGTGPQTLRDRAVLDWVRNVARDARRVASVCTGAFLLAEAGVLNGKRATTHWKYAKGLASRFPQVTVEPDRIYLQDGRTYTSAGVTAGMDLALALVEEDLGSAVALQVARVLVLYLRRPGGQRQFSTLLSAQASDYKSFPELQIWMAENLREDLSVEALASHMAMGVRNFARVFVREMGITPAHFVDQLRLDYARGKLEVTDKSLEQVAEAAGFRSAEVMRRAFIRVLGVPPGAYRSRFRSRRD
jgi:transcriptional regulator GlxA family with amidase domain